MEKVFKSPSVVLKKSLSLILIVLVALSCSGDDEEVVNNEMEEPVLEDTYVYIALRNDGQLFKIGNNTGVVEKSGKISQLEFNTAFNTITNSPLNTYVFEPWFDPVEGRLNVRNRNTGTSTKTILNFPEEFGGAPGFMSLDWDNTNNELVGVLGSDIAISSIDRILKVVKINPESLEITVVNDLNLQALGYKNVFSSQLIGQKLYASASKTQDFINNDILEIDLINKTIEILPQVGIETGLLNFGVNPNSNKIFGFAPVLNTGFGNAVRPYVYDIDQRSISEINSIPRISALIFAQKSFYNPFNQSIVTLILNEGHQLLTLNTLNETFELIKITNPDELSSLISIIDVIKL